ncbi:MAG: serine/threonine protein kinase, partial [Chloroflexi bacterium]|nr:serine/threonine protein kinase [Chloroflexota bacterium]
MAEPGDRLGGRCELIEVIGSGGMAVVWRARDTRLRRTVAVKILRPQFAGDAEFVERFESEARHAASLAHPNVAAVFDTGFDPGPDGGTRFIVMELIDGPSVAEVLHGGPLPVALALEIATAAARALAAAHRRGIVHRDVKP